jgi:rhodanese-related sulfurtransferase
MVKARALIIPIVLVWAMAAKASVLADEYCGIYALYGATKALGIQAEFSDLVNTRFVSSIRGSTVMDLLHAADELGVKATPYANLGYRSLLNSQDPLLLHISSEGQVAIYDHWLLFLGCRNGSCLIADESGIATSVELDWILARWNGIAIAVHKGDLPHTKFWLVELQTLLFGLAYLMGGILLVRWSDGQGTAARIVVIASCIFLGSLFFLPLLGYSSRFGSAGFAYQRLCSQQAELMPANLHAVERLSQLIESGATNAMIVDSRFRHDTSNGMIRGAVNLPVNIHDSELRNSTETVPKDAEIVVYCLSRRCRFSHMIGARLVALGFQNVRIYEPGWYGWLNQEKD